MSKLYADNTAMLRTSSGAVPVNADRPRVIDLRDGNHPTPNRKPTRPRERPQLRSRWGVGPLLLAADLAAVAVAVAAFDGLRVFGLLFGITLVLLFAMGGLYRSRLNLALLDDVPALVGRGVAATPLAVLAAIGLENVGFGSFEFGWRLLLLMAVVGLGVVAMRALSYWFVRSQRRSRRVAHRTLIMGAGHVGAQIAETLSQHPEYGLHPVGFIDDNPRDSATKSGLPILGGAEELTDVLIDERVHNAIVAFSSMQEAQIVSLIRTCDRLKCELFVVPRLFELHTTSNEMDSVWGLPLVRLRRAPYRTQSWRVKRAFDIVVSGAALAVLSPLMLLIALAVRLDGGPGVLFKQERVGVDGRKFTLMKFRSMRPATEAESATTWNISQDHRLGKLGKALRKSSLDELPQLINILRGDMSIVGPRPERPHFVEQFQETYPHYVARHRVPSGLTGWAQVHGLRGDTSIAERARFDNYSIENWSLWLDVKIIIRTVGSVIRGQGG